MHIVLREKDLPTAVELGLLESIDQDVYCKACEEAVGVYEGLFYPFAVVLDSDDNDWVVCYECYWPVVNPTTSLSD